MLVSLLTPTGARPEAFALCEKYVQGFQRSHKVEWIVVDDGQQKLTKNFPCTIIRPQPLYPFHPEKNTQHRNIAEGLKVCKGDYIFIIEDDDWYGPNYIEESLEYLKSYELVGETPARYYNVFTRCHRTFPSEKHASLCQTSFRRSVIPTLLEVCTNQLWIDILLWKNFKGSKRLYTSNRVVGIKGLPGREGVGKSHKNTNHPSWIPDYYLEELKSWIGSDAENYRKFYEGEKQVRRVRTKQPELESKSINPNDPLLPAAVRENSSEWKTFMWGGQIRYKCPDCGFDAPTKLDVRKHWISTHKVKGNNPGVTLFDADDKPIPKQTIGDIPDILKGVE